MLIDEKSQAVYQGNQRIKGSVQFNVKEVESHAVQSEDDNSFLSDSINHGIKINVMKRVESPEAP